MSEPDKPKRRWFQFHLSTAVVMMIVASGCLWANSRYRNIEVLFQEEWNDAGDMMQTNAALGWPFVMGVPDIRLERYGKIDESASLILKMRWSRFRIAQNVGISLSIVFSAALICESIIRRREARKT